LPADDERPKLRLKNGSEVDAQIAYVRWRMLGAEQTTRPHLVEALLAFARGNPDSISTEVAAETKERHSFWFTRDGALEPIVRDVLLSAYRETPDGVVIVNPFDLRTQQEADTLSEIQRQDDLLIRRGFRDKGEQPPGQSR